MNIIYTVGLVVIQNTKLLLVRKRNTAMFILPGGKFDTGESEIACIVREIREELLCHIQLETLHFLGKYSDIAANEPETQVVMKLYKGAIIDIPQPSSEIEEIFWFDIRENERILVAPLVKNKIIPLLNIRNCFQIENGISRFPYGKGANSENESCEERKRE